MDQFDRQHFRNTSTGNTTTTSTSSELFICFTSRLSSSSSSMKLTKSIFSPGRARDAGGGPVSLSSSLSRRLRTNGSIKGGGGGQASPFFTTTGKKRGCGFENPEPTSPKVTCIGQVRVKTKKRVKKSRSLSTRRSNGEVSFRKSEEKGPCNHQQQECLPHRNQRWVHLPISICEALRAFGAEFNCLFPCKSSCFSTSEKVDKGSGFCGNENGCGACFTRWFVSVNDRESGKRREIELVVGGGDEVEEERRISMRSSRRHVFEDIEVRGDVIEVKGKSGTSNPYVKEEEIEEEEARVSICVPPKNALLLMRCRSDPMKMASLAHRFSWDAHATNNVNLDDEEEEEKEESNNSDRNDRKDEIFMVKKVLGEVLEEDIVASVEPPNEELETIVVVEEAEDSNLEMEIQEHEEMVENKELEVNEEEALVVVEEQEEEEEEEVESNMSSFEALLNQENPEHNYEDCPILDNDEEEQSSICHLSTSTKSSPSSEDSESEDVTGSSTEAPLEKEFEENNLKPDPEKTNVELTIPSSENDELINITKEEPKIKERERQKVLPDCLLLMMCEPKLSMEVSKETWVCSTDFIRWLPQRPPKQPLPPPPPKSATKSGEPVKRRLSTDTKPKQIDDHSQLPPRSSCSLPMPAAAMIEQKLMNAVGYEPFALTRCKSEPMRTAAAKLLPESCVWKNAIKKLDPHRRATIGVGATGVGC